MVARAPPYMMHDRLILLTNDDGITAPGLVAMYRKLADMGDVQVVAPETVQSASGHGITLSQPLLTSKVDVENAFSGTAVAGSPADCVKLAISQLTPRRPDLVISGINSALMSASTCFIPAPSPPPSRPHFSASPPLPSHFT